jgi:hypothetical protein
MKAAARAILPIFMLRFLWLMSAANQQQRRSFLRRDHTQRRNGVHPPRHHDPRLNDVGSIPDTGSGA